MKQMHDRLLILSDMAYVQQICEGYNKRSLMGNWMEERLYPAQPFRENLTKQVPPHSRSLAPRTKPSPPSTAPPSNAPSPD
jgi:hypothetical protein